MKKINFGLIVLSITLFTALISCKDPFHVEPYLPGGSGGQGGAPEGLTATHGERRSISLSWDSDSSAALYYIYKASIPLENFERCGETSTNQFTINVAPGSTVYYRVSSVSHTGVESRQSVYVKGTSLAQPVISDITDIDESGAAVTWYMDNVSDDTYKNNLLYTIYCYNGATQVAQMAMDGSVLTENKVFFAGLNANTRYEYQVEAYLRSNQDTSEKSDLMDAATARRFRPGPAFRPRATRGRSTNKIDISFELPDMVDIALGDNMFEPHPIYFVISKRPYSQFQNNDYQIVCTRFDRSEFGDYITGKLVSWTDTGAGVRRGVEYEYQIQSYVDDTPKLISSDASKANAVGWALAEGSLDFGDIEYTPHEEDDVFISAKLPLVFNFDPLDEEYNYTLVEKIEPLLDGDNNDPVSSFSRNHSFNNYDAIRAHIPQMDLTQKTTPNNPGRGLYSYAVEIRLGADLLDTIDTFDQKEVSENTQPIVVEGFHIQDGYKNKFVLKWHNYSNRKYTISVSDDRTTWTEIGTVNTNPTNDEGATVDTNFSWETPGSSGYSPNETKYFRIQPSRNLGGGTFKDGQPVSFQAVYTLGVPELSMDDNQPSYSTITPAWTEARKADHYRISYNYGSGWQVAETVARTDPKIIVDGQGKLKYSFKPDGHDDVNKAGEEIQIKVEALNIGLQTEAGGGEISTSSAEGSVKLVGPAKLNLSVSKADSVSEINISWDQISGAGGYYVFRRQFNMTNATQEGTEAVVYYIPAQLTGSNNITGKNLRVDESNAKLDTQTVKASISLDGTRYTLKDIRMTDIEYDGQYYSYIPAYKDQQNNMSQGYPYRYYVVPALAGEEPVISFVYSRDSTGKNTAISSYTINENGSNIVYSGAADLEKEGFVTGFGQNVIATKGTYYSNSNDKVNNGIRITWEKPPLLNADNISYEVYRKGYGSSDWIPVGTANGQTLTDNPPTSGIAYEYAVGIKTGSSNETSQPQYSRRFIDLCYTQRDNRDRPNMLGFQLGLVKMQSVSRDARKAGNEFAEEVKWFSAGIKNNADADFNWGIDGYKIYLLNRNINNNRQWMEVADVSTLTNYEAQGFLVANNANNILKVLRDYRHYYKVRSYVLNGEEKVFCPDPFESYLVPDGKNDADVMWGARQVSSEEWAAITSLSIGTAMNWWKNMSEVPDRRGDHNVSISESNVGYNRDINFNNSKPYFVNIYGHLYGHCEATGQTPTQYGADCSGIWGALSGPKDHLSTLTITGPSDVSMYSGTVTILRLGSGANWGPYKVTYNGYNGEVEGRHYRNNFTFTAGSGNYKRTREHDWSFATGICLANETWPFNGNKWWYPIGGGRDGWD